MITVDELIGLLTIEDPDDEVTLEGGFDDDGQLVVTLRVGEQILMEREED